MKQATIAGGLLPVLLITLASSAPVRGLEQAEVRIRDGITVEQERAYANAIREIESRDGAYGANLSESLLSLGLTLQAQGRHGEAADAFRRGAHVTRINDGLYSAQQVPLLEGEIASYIALANYAQADERQNYLYRVQLRSMASGDSLADAYMQQASWQYKAYQMGVGPDSYTRLMNMWDLYRRALQDVMAREGEHSVKLLPPLRGMLQTQYLISSYEWQEQNPSFTEQGRIDPNLLRFKAYRSESYHKGNAVISASADIELERNEEHSLALAKTRVMQGDWSLWHGKTQAAWEAYREAETELAQRGDAQSVTQQLFSEPVALPDIAGLSPLPPTVEPEQADVLLEFGVNERGRVMNLERKDENDAQDAQARRLMRTLRKTTFRPRFEAGQAVETKKLVKAFSVQ
jgi:tetratricopeptide (TPR) repeat protein